MGSRTRGSRAVAVFAALGAASGTIAYLLVLFGPQWRIALGALPTLDPISTLPGLSFGLIIGFALYRRGVAGPWGYAAYLAASTLSYFCAYHFAREVLADLFDLVAFTGMAAGLSGAALLTGATAMLFRFARKFRPCCLMLASGCLLGALLQVAFLDDDGYYVVFLFAPWQAGYAASLATALRKRPTFS